ncbi:Hypothetical predicted protein [Mytilus galloprovincialis]|uniref:Core-binding (CB) domain-containing protein n=2 Tax=Mytilus galloprovincialis TaxID=29158 RepID=A0A8B6G5Z1_MYTGA|nr:Hypothetical predicted protein [Mytilus galloprovincialis]
MTSERAYVRAEQQIRNILNIPEWYIFSNAEIRYVARELKNSEGNLTRFYWTLRMDCAAQCNGCLFCGEILKLCNIHNRYSRQAGERERIQHGGDEQLPATSIQAQLNACATETIDGGAVQTGSGDIYVQAITKQLQQQQSLPLGDNLNKHQGQSTVHPEDEKPKIISPMGVIPKPGGGIRLIHDCSRPEGSAVNDFAGFAINWSKVVDPCQQITFLGVEIDSSTMEVRLPSDKLAVLKAELLAFTKRSHASKKQLQSLAGEIKLGVCGSQGSKEMTALDDIVLDFRCHAYAESTKKTYMTYLKSFVAFCNLIGIPVVPLSQENLARYIAHLSRRLKYNSLCNYLSIIRILHLEAGYSSPIDTHLVSNVLKGARRVLGDVNTAKLPITPKILFKIFAIISFNDTKDVAFWAACLVAFFSFFRKSNLLTPSVNDFDPDRHLSRHNVFFREDGVLLRISKSKTIQFAERCLDIPLPAIKNSPLCPSQALLLNFKMVPAVQTPSPAFLYQNGEDTIPLTYAVFLARLKTVLSIIGFDASLYSGHSFRRGGATFAFQCGVPGELIQSQGDWKSDAYKGYLDPSPSYRLHVMKTFANALKLST